MKKIFIIEIEESEEKDLESKKFKIKVRPKWILDSGITKSGKRLFELEGDDFFANQTLITNFELEKVKNPGNLENRIKQDLVHSMANIILEEIYLNNKKQ